MFVHSISAPYPDRVVLVHNTSRVERQKQSEERPKTTDSVNHSTYQEYLLRNSLEELRDVLVDVSQSDRRSSSRDEFNDDSLELPQQSVEIPKPEISTIDLTENPSITNDSSAANLESTETSIPRNDAPSKVSRRIDFYDSQAIAGSKNFQIPRADVERPRTVSDAGTRLSESRAVSRVDATAASFSPTSQLRKSADQIDAKPLQPTVETKLRDRLSQLFSDELLFEPASEKMLSARAEIASILNEVNSPLLPYSEPSEGFDRPTDQPTDQPPEFAAEFPPSEYDDFYFTDHNLLVARLLKSIDSILARTEPVLDLGSIVNILA